VGLSVRRPAAAFSTQHPLSLEPVIQLMAFFGAARQKQLVRAFSDFIVTQ
jgi:hypothetical protein